MSLPRVGCESLQPSTAATIPRTAVAECLALSCGCQPVIPETEDRVPLLSAERMQQLQKQIELQKQKRVNVFLLRE